MTERKNPDSPKLTHLPLRHIFVTQPFGVNYVDFYFNLGLSGH